MPNLPSVSGKQCVAALAKIGFYIKRRSGGNHYYLQRDEPYANVAVPDHRQIATGTLRAIIRDAGLTVEQFIALL